MIWKNTEITKQRATIEKLLFWKFPQESPTTRPTVAAIFAVLSEFTLI